MASEPRYSTAQIVRAASTAQLSTGASVVAQIPRTSSGDKVAFVRVAVSGGAAYVKLATSTAVSAVTGDTIVSVSDALWLNTLGLGFVAFLQTAPGGVAFGSVAACEEGGVRVPADTSGLG